MISSSAFEIVGLPPSAVTNDNLQNEHPVAIRMAGCVVPNTGSLFVPLPVMPRFSSVSYWPDIVTMVVSTPQAERTDVEGSAATMRTPDDDTARPPGVLMQHDAPGGT